MPAASPESREQKRQTSEELLAAVSGGQQAALADLYDRFAPLALGLAFRILRDAHLAEDVTQAAFASVWSSAPRFDPSRAAAQTWIFGILRNKAIDELRRQRRQRTHPVPAEQLEEMAAPIEVPVEVIALETRRETRGALRRLPIEQRQVIELAYFHGYTQSEISAMLVLPLGTVKSRTRLALEALRRADAIAS